MPDRSFVTLTGHITCYRHTISCRLTACGHQPIVVAVAATPRSLYTGIGGLDFDFEAAGFHTAVAVELDPAACRTIRQNRLGWNVIERDIHDVSSAEILDTAGLQVGKTDVLIGGPPCQPFSKSSYWVNGDAVRLDDPRADTLTAYLRVLRDTRPKAFLL